MKYNQPIIIELNTAILLQGALVLKLFGARDLSSCFLVPTHW